MPKSYGWPETTADEALKWWSQFRGDSMHPAHAAALVGEVQRLRAIVARVREYAGTEDLHKAAESYRNEGTYAYGFARGEASVMAGLREVLDGKPEVEWGYAPDGTAVPAPDESGIL